LRTKFDSAPPEKEVRSSESEGEAVKASEYIAYLLDQTHNFESKERYRTYTLKEESMKIIKHYKLCEKPGGTEYEENLKLVKVELIKSFYRRLKKEKRKLLNIKKNIRDALNAHKRKLKETNDLIAQGFLNSEDLAEVINFQLKESKEEIQREIEIEEGWEALRNFDPDQPLPFSMPMYPVKQPA